MKEVGVHRGIAVQIQIMFLGNDPERERGFIPLMSNEVDLPAPNKIKGIIFQTTKWGGFCFIWTAPQHAQSCKELIQTDLRRSTVEREQKTTKQKERRTPSSFFLHSTGEYEHMISHMLPPHTHIHTYIYMWRHTKALWGASWTFPAQLPSHPLFKRPALTDFQIKRRLHSGPLKALYRASIHPFPLCSQPPSSQLKPLPWAALAGSLRCRMNGPGTREPGEKESETAHINWMVSNWFVPPEHHQQHPIHFNLNVFCLTM